MNLHKKTEMDVFDLGLKHTLKKWAVRQHPPLDGKARLVDTVIQRTREPKESRIAIFLMWAFNDNYNNIHFERFSNIHHIFIASGAVSAN